MKTLNHECPLIRPEESEIEISIFGPGYGECVVLHLGYGRWIIIDSCVDRGKKYPEALRYLKSINVDPSKEVLAIVATHWHDDHIKGLSTIVEECKSAVFICSVAIKKKEFLELIEMNRVSAIGDNQSGISEFLSIFDILTERNKRPKFAIAERQLWTSKLPGMSDCEIYALSPSDFEVDKAIKQLAKIIPDILSNPRRIPCPDQNDTSVVIWAKVGSENIFLFGADLEEKGNNDTGWSAIVSSGFYSTDLAYIHKIPHHGSHNAHYMPVWERMLCPNPISVLTPWTRGNNRLPSDIDLGRLSKLTSKLFITASPDTVRKRKRKDVLISRFINKYTKYIRYAEPACGHIVLRKGIKDAHSEWKVSLRDGAL
ncbi:Metallo-beta-lactamase superfamily protein [Desulfofustis glycolicus DSM 9705]|uniref:Metallo-beta-lactamase superfamily protein n=2 Tax=Desulfofustis glycolicus TaxID=51195 RepID=A0A1M5YVL7_9BACT|nr:Metallo-beta-lactamase superfamily protein [Desulfofustis glycolicus DSM 9705]